MPEREDEAARAAFAVFRDRFDAPEPAEDLVATERYFAAACDAGAVPPLTLDDDDLRAAPEDTRERLRAVQGRLRRLGYAAVPEADTADWAPLRPAFAEFQREAGLCEAGRASGELTLADWRALQEIFNFETPLVVDRWFTDGKANLALERAARLRLSALGFGRKPQVGDWNIEPAALARFAAVAHSFGLAERALTAEITREFAAVLFGHDAMVARIAAWSGPLPGGAEERGFLVCLAKVELWLHGFDITPDGDPALTVRAYHGGRHGVWRDDPSPTANLIIGACEDLFADPAAQPPPRRAERIPERVPELLAALNRLQHDAEANLAEAGRDSAALIGTLQARIEGRRHLWDEIFKAGKALTATLYDGVKRVVAWLTRFFAKALEWTKNALVNAWRAIYHFMGSAALRLRRALRALAEGAQFFTARTVTDETRRIVYAKNGDFDAKVIVDAAVGEEQARQFAEGLRCRAGAFGIACRMLRLIATGIRIALGGAASALGGFVPLLLGLASAYSQIRDLDAQLEAYESAGAGVPALQCR